MDLSQIVTQFEDQLDVLAGKTEVPITLPLLNPDAPGSQKRSSNTVKYLDPHASWYEAGGGNPISTVLSDLLRQDDEAVVIAFRYDADSFKPFKERYEGKTVANEESAQRLYNHCQTWLSDNAQHAIRQSLKTQVKFTERALFKKTVETLLGDKTAKFLCFPWDVARRMFPRIQTAALTLASPRLATGVYDTESVVIDLRSCPLWVFLIYLEVFCFSTNFLYSVIAGSSRKDRLKTQAQAYKMTQQLNIIALSDMVDISDPPRHLQKTLRLTPLPETTWLARKIAGNVCMIRWEYKTWELGDVWITSHAERCMAGDIPLDDILLAEFCLTSSTYLVEEERLLRFASAVLDRQPVSETNVSDAESKVDSALSAANYIEAIVKMAPQTPRSVIEYLCASEHPLAQSRVANAWRLLRHLRLAAWSPEKIVFLLAGHRHVPAWVAALAYEVSLARAELNSSLADGSTSQTDAAVAFHNREDAYFDAFLASPFAQQLSEVKDTTVTFQRQIYSPTTLLEKWMQPVSSFDVVCAYSFRPCFLGRSIRSVWPIFKSLPRPFQSFLPGSVILREPRHIRETYAFLHAKTPGQSPSLADYVVSCTKLYAASTRNIDASAINEQCNGKESLMFVFLVGTTRYQFLVSFLPLYAQDVSVNCRVLRGLVQTDDNVTSLNMKGSQFARGDGKLIFDKYTFDIATQTYKVDNDSKPFNYIEIFSIDCPFNNDGPYIKVTSSQIE